MSTTHEAGKSAQSILTTSGDREIKVERIFDATRERVWKAQTDPALLKQWWGRGHELVIERYELERGGHWRFVEKTPDGQSHGFEGRFREVKPMELLEMTFGWDGLPGRPSINSARFEDLGDGRTKLVATLSFFTKEERDGMIKSGMKGGMDMSYAVLDKLLAQS